MHPSTWPAHRWVVVALVVLDVVVLALVLGATGVVTNAAKALDPQSLSLCAARAADPLGADLVFPAPGAEARFDGPRTIRLDVVWTDGGRRREATVRCAVRVVHSDDDRLVVTSAEVVT